MLEKLDIGCGKFKKEGFLGIDIEDFSDMYPEGEFQIVDIEKGLPFEDESFSFIRCSHVIEHMKKPGKLLDEILRVAKEGCEIVMVWPIEDELSPGHEFCPEINYMERMGMGSVTDIVYKSVHDRDSITLNGEPFTFKECVVRMMRRR